MSLREIHLSSIEETKSLGKSLSTFLTSPMTVGLVGELGAGKTTLTKSILEALNYQEPVSSPTFVLQNEYKIGNKVIAHWDLYRLNIPPDELLEPRSTNEIRLIEWPNKFPEVLASCDLILNIKLTTTSKDSLSISRQCIISGRLSEDFSRHLWAKS